MIFDNRWRKEGNCARKGKEETKALNWKKKKRKRLLEKEEGIIVERENEILMLDINGCLFYSTGNGKRWNPYFSAEVKGVVSSTCNIVVCARADCFPGGWMERSRRMEWKRRRTYGVERDSWNVSRMEINFNFFTSYTLVKRTYYKYTHRYTNTCIHVRTVISRTYTRYITIYIKISMYDSSREFKFLFCLKYPFIILKWMIFFLDCLKKEKEKNEKDEIVYWKDTSIRFLIM